jgi:hypothetical protein
MHRAQLGWAGLGYLMMENHHATNTTQPPSQNPPNSKPPHAQLNPATAKSHPDPRTAACPKDHASLYNAKHPPASHPIPNRISLNTLLNSLQST